MADTDVAANEPDASHDNPNSPDVQDNVASPPRAVEADAPTTAAPDSAGPSTEPAAPDLETRATQRRFLFQEFRDFLLGFTAPRLRAEPWSFLDQDDKWLRIDMPTVEFLEVMQEQCTAEFLVVSGLCEYADEKLRPVARLDGETSLYVAIDDDQGSFRFRTGGEFLFPMIKTARDYALERIPSDSTQTPDTLFVVDSQEAAEILHRLGLVAVTYEGLDDLGCEDVKRLFEPDDRSDCRWRYYLSAFRF